MWARDVMKKFRNHLIGIDQGDVVLFSDFETDGEMWAGTGPRQFRSHISFSEPFKEPPAVSVHLSMWDISNAATARADVTSEDVTEEGFVIVFRTWGDSKIARVRVGWTAMGEVAHDDDWSLY